MLERFDLKGKVILLTGGAGLYGRGLAADIAGANATVIVASRNREAGEIVAQEERELGREVVAEAFDQGDEESILRLSERILERHGRLDGLVNNSVARPMTSAGAPREAWEASMRVNATGVFLMHRHFGEILCRQKSGSIVNVGSIHGMVGPAANLYASGLELMPPDYFFHKAGLLNLTRYYAALYGPAGVRVNCLSPGGFFNHQDETFVKLYNKQTFLGRMGNKADLGGAVVFLLGNASEYVTGVNLPVDGGYTAR